MLFEKEIGKLGFGLMRLPKKDNVIDIEQVKEMTDRFMEAGFTYFDTAWAYEGSEEAVRQALVERYPRESFQLATKNAAWIQCKTREDAIAQFAADVYGDGITMPQGLGTGQLFTDNIPMPLEIRGEKLWRCR